MRSPQAYGNRREDSSMRDMRRLISQFDDFFRDMSPDQLSENKEFTPLVDIEENDEIYLISTDLPGLKKEDIKIDISGNVLKISGKKRRETKEDGYYERSSGQFYRSFSLPERVDTEKVEANFEDGVLKIVLPKMEVKASQEIKIQSGPSQGLIDRFLKKESPTQSKEKSKH